GAQLYFRMKVVHLHSGGGVNVAAGYRARVSIPFIRNNIYFASKTVLGVNTTVSVVAKHGYVYHEKPGK
ncbi:MAG: hypothetical protein FWB79_03035, partial [Treponema sp.]|nr:hypothetical protein [Treponema sp.]